MSDAEKDMIKKEASSSGDSDAVYKIFIFIKFLFDVYNILFDYFLSLIFRKSNWLIKTDGTFTNKKVKKTNYPEL